MAVALALLLQIVLAQRPHREGADKGPRAMGLIELAPNGKAHLIPITIMVNGEFYDASEYKASPVPMSLDTGTVYEAVKTGISQGLFTVKGAIAGTKTWRGEGTWESEAEIKAEESKKKAAAAAAKLAKKKPTLDDGGGPPVLRRAGAAKPGSPEKAASDESKKSESTPTTPATGKASSSGNGSPVATEKTAAPDVPSPSSTSDEDDPNRPQLRRSKAPKNEAKKQDARGPATVSPLADNKTPTTTTPVASAAGIQIIPAVSDAGGPEPRSYEFNMNPDEERQFRNKIMAMAATEVTARANSLRSEIPVSPAAHTTTRRGKPVKSTGPMFQDVQFRVFDLSNSNEAVVVLTAKAQIPASKADGTGSLPANYFLTLIAREDIYGELHKALSNVTDDRHLDILPRLDLIDAVDVDGDGRGELLFRRVSDAGSGYVVYRVIGNQLWPLFQGAIG